MEMQQLIVECLKQVCFVGGLAVGLIVAPLFALLAWSK